MNTLLVPVLLALASRGSLALEEDPVHPALEGCNERWRTAAGEFGAGAIALAVVQGGEVVHRFTWGRRDPESEAPVTRDTVFYIASATKPYVAFALMQLVEQGRVDLDAPVHRYLPRFQLADPDATESLTVRQLLCHAEGLNSFPIVLLDAYTGEITEDRFYHFLPEVHPRGTTSYSNLHFTLAGRIVEAVSGQPWREALRAHVFEPAGMTRTSGYASWMYGQDDVALPATWEGGRVVRAALRKSDATMHAAGGLGTTIDDFARWAGLQLGYGQLDGKRLLAETSIDEMFALQSESDDSGIIGRIEGFGLGWQRGSYRDHLLMGHGGGYVGCTSWVGFLPEIDLGLVFLGTGGQGAMALATLAATDVLERFLADDAIADPLPELRRHTLAARARPGRSETAAPFEPALDSAAYAGPWRNEWFGTLRFDLAGASTARFGDMPLTVESAGEESFVLRCADMAIEGRFVVGGGQVVGVELDLGGLQRFE